MSDCLASAVLSRAPETRPAMLLNLCMDTLISIISFTFAHVACRKGKIIIKTCVHQLHEVSFPGPRPAGLAGTCVDAVLQTQM